MLFVKKELEVSLVSEVFLSNFPAIDVKKLLKWLATIYSSNIVLLLIFRVSRWDPFLDILVLMRIFMPYHIFFGFILFWFQKRFEVIFFAKTICINYLISAFFNFLMKINSLRWVSGLTKLFV